MGVRTGVSHVLIHQMVCGESADPLNQPLRHVAGKMGLRGTVVGMATTIDLRSHRLVSANDQDISVSLLTLLPRHNELAARTESSNGDPNTSISTNLLVFVNRRLTHEEMLEAMALGVEVRTRALGHSNQMGEGSLLALGATGRYRGDGLRKLLHRTFIQCLSG
jgi:adenosylcobinamide amidohydrolase